MKKAYIQLVLEGPNVSIEDAENFAQAITIALGMVPSPDGQSIKVGTITLQNSEEQA
jgi:hypothetical protein